MHAHGKDIKKSLNRRSNKIKHSHTEAKLAAAQGHSISDKTSPPPHIVISDASTGMKILARTATGEIVLK